MTISHEKKIYFLLFLNHGILLLLLVFISACKKLPKETHRGRNIMACYLNGGKWEANNKLFRDNWIGSPGGSTDNQNPEAIIDNTDNTLTISGCSCKNDADYEIINIGIKNFKGPGVYIANPSEQGFASTYSGYHTDSVNTGIINIKYYTGKVVAGTFTFKAGNYSWGGNRYGDTVNITEGRFDIKYTTK